MNIKQIIKEEIGDFDWVSQHMETVPDDPHHLTIIKCYADEDNVLDGINEETWSHYGLTVYTNDNGSEFAVGSTREFDDALLEYYENILDDVGLDGWNIDVEDYLYMTNTDINLYADDMTESMMGDFRDDDDVLEYLENDNENVVSYNVIVDKILEIESEIDDLKTKQDEFDETDDDMFWLVGDEIEELSKQIDNLETEKEDIIDDVREDVRSQIYSDYHDRLSTEPLEYFTEMGYTLTELVDTGILSFDREQFVEDLSNMSDYGELNSYDGNYCVEHINGTDYFCVRIS